MDDAEDAPTRRTGAGWGLAMGAIGLAIVSNEPETGLLATELLAWLPPAGNARDGSMLRAIVKPGGEADEEDQAKKEGDLASRIYVLRRGFPHRLYVTLKPTGRARQPAPLAAAP